MFLSDLSDSVSLAEPRQISFSTTEETYKVGTLVFNLFDQGRGNGGAVQRNKAIPTARAGFVSRACDQFLTGAGFALNQHSRVNLRNQIDLIKQRAEFRTRPNQFSGLHLHPLLKTNSKEVLIPFGRCD